MDATLSIPFTYPREGFSLIRFPFPLGKGLGVGLLVSMIMPKTIFDGTKLPMVVEPSQDHYIWYKPSFGF